MLALVCTSDGEFVSGSGFTPRGVPEGRHYGQPINRLSFAQAFCHAPGTQGVPDTYEAWGLTPAHSPESMERKLCYT